MSYEMLCQLAMIFIVTMTARNVAMQHSKDVVKQRSATEVLDTTSIWLRSMIGLALTMIVQLVAFGAIDVFDAYNARSTIALVAVCAFMTISDLKEINVIKSYRVFRNLHTTCGFIFVMNYILCFIPL